MTRAVVEVPLSKNKKAIVDSEDFQFISQWKWSFSNYAIRVIRSHKKDQRTIYMHKEIMSPPKGFQVDHINGDKLDNRKSNLRICTSQQNSFNHPGRKTSKYKGIYFEKSRNKWASQIIVNRKHISLGRFKTPEEAALAYNIGAKKYFGEFARINNL